MDLKTANPAVDIGAAALTSKGIFGLLEISPLPFAIAPVLRELSCGLPTFYIAFGPGAKAVADDELVEPATPFGAVTGDAFLGVLFQDRVAVAPWEWMRRIREAMAAAGESTAAWDIFRSRLYPAGKRELRVLDHAGRPAPAGWVFDLRQGQGAWTKVVTDAKGALTLPPATNQTTEVKWRGDARAGDKPHPVQAIYETSQSAPPGGAVALPSDFDRGHQQVLDLSRWLAPRRGGTAPTLMRSHTDSRVEPLIDGIPTFKRLVDDLLECGGKGYGAHFAGWGFKDFPLDADRRDADDREIDTHLTALTKRIIDNEGDVRFLVNRLVTFTKDPDSAAAEAGVAALMVLTHTLVLAQMTGILEANTLGYFMLGLAGYLGAGLISSEFSAREFVEGKLEQSLDIFPELNKIKVVDGVAQIIAIWSRHPARLRDNPLPSDKVPSFPLGLEKYLDRFGTWHQKIQLIKRPADKDGNEYIAYLGGIDIADNRLDTPGHQIGNPFHDVHARITGPAAADVFQTWHERWAFDRKPGSDPDPVFDPPLPTSLPKQTAKHIVQIGRTYFKPFPGNDTRPASSTKALDFAKEGETTTNDTLIRAIQSAREIIYIEDQYFLPSDTDEPDEKQTYFNALVAAAKTCKRLVILLPSAPDQPLGGMRRAQLFKKLAGAWGNNMVVGSPLRRTVLPSAGLVTSQGRCTLMEDASAADGEIVIGPKSRVPGSGPFWLWINGELMLSGLFELPKTSDPASVVLDVLRGPMGSDARWGATVRAHDKGSPVTVAQVRGIYVHAKLMIVDDTFVSIGSTNMNRRGLYHDGELNVFAIPEQLKAAPDNPARRLRATLWAEHLGIPPAMGPALFDDPLAAFELFRRSRCGGNRFVPFATLDVHPYLSLSTSDAIAGQILRLGGFVLGGALLDEVWNWVSDPTSENDPDPTWGPDLAKP